MLIVGRRPTTDDRQPTTDDRRKHVRNGALKRRDDPPGRLSMFAVVCDEMPTTDDDRHTPWAYADLFTDTGDPCCIAALPSEYMLQ
jgi:hypothetical protein